MAAGSGALLAISGALAGCAGPSSDSTVPSPEPLAGSSSAPTAATEPSASPAAAIKPVTQRLSGADGSSLRVRFTPDGLDEQGRQRIVMTITNTSQGPRRFFIQVEPADRNSSDTGDALNHYTESIAAGKKYSLNLTAGGPVTMTSAQLCRSADPSLVARVGWDRGWSKKHQTDEGLDNWQVVGRLSPEAPMVIIEVESTDKDGKSVDSWGWNAGGLPEIGVTWGPEVRPGTKVTLTSVATCSSWNVWDDN